MPDRDALGTIPDEVIEQLTEWTRARDQFLEEESAREDAEESLRNYAQRRLGQAIPPAAVMLPAPEISDQGSTGSSVGHAMASVVGMHALTLDRNPDGRVYARNDWSSAIVSGATSTAELEARIRVLEERLERLERYLGPAFSAAVPVQSPTGPTSEPGPTAWERLVEDEPV